MQLTGKLFLQNSVPAQIRNLSGTILAKGEPSDEKNAKLQTAKNYIVREKVGNRQVPQPTCFLKTFSPGRDPVQLGRGQMKSFISILWEVSRGKVA